MVERELPGITMEELAAAQQAAIETSQLMAAAGKPVRYIRSVFLPGESRCLCLFEADGPELAQEVNDAAQVPYTRILNAVDLTP
jgi:hypothetical protein